MLRLSSAAWACAALLAAGAAGAEPAGGDPLDDARAAMERGEAGRAVKLLRVAVSLRGEGPGVAELRLALGEALLAEGRKPLACNELARAKRLDPSAFALGGGPALERRACGGLQAVASVEPAGRRDAAQVFVVPRRLGGPRELWRALAEAGADLAFVRAFHLKGDRHHEEVPTNEVEGVYFATEEAPVVEDRLALDCAAARAQGLRCHAWMTTRATPVPALDHARHRDVEWDFRTGEYVEVARLDPFDPKVERVLRRLWQDLARAGVDGVLMQDDLMMRQLEGFSPEARRTWRRRTGTDLDPERLVSVRGAGAAARVSYEEAFWEFARPKRDRLLDLAEGLQAAAREINPRFETSLNLYYETVVNPPMGLAWMSQDLDAAAARDFRRLAVMAYHRQIADELAIAGRRELLEGLERMAGRLATVPGSAERVLVKLQSIDWSTREPVPATELAETAAPFRRFTLCLAPADDPELAPRQLRALRGSAP
jgi:biofilm PGA synthesis lipoprotein PgaB